MRRGSADPSSTSCQFAPTKFSSSGDESTKFSDPKRRRRERKTGKSAVMGTIRGGGAKAQPPMSVVYCICFCLFCELTLTSQRMEFFQGKPGRMAGREHMKLAFGTKCWNLLVVCMFCSLTFFLFFFFSFGFVFPFFFFLFPPSTCTYRRGKASL